METKARSRAGLWIVIVVLFLMLGLSVMLNFGVIMSSAIVSGAFSSPRNENELVDEIWESGRGADKVIQLEVKGPIMRSTASGLFGGQVDMVEDLLIKIETATDDESVKGIILDVNSPGGAVTPTDEIYKALMDFKKSREGRRIVTFVRDSAVSGSYWLAVTGDSLVAQPTSMIGSIGVMLQSINISGLSEKLGISDTTIKSGKNKDLLNPWQKSEEEHVALLQEMIDETHVYFKQLILRHRPIAKAKLDEIADGRIMTSRDALESGLIDSIGYWEDALDETKRLLGTDKFRVIRYQRRGKGFMQLFTSQNVADFGSLRLFSGPKLMSLLEL